MSPVAPAWATRLLLQCPSCPALLPSRLTLARHLDGHARLNAAAPDLSTEIDSESSEPLHNSSVDGKALAPVREASRGPDSTVLEEKLDPDYEPSEAEVREYAVWLGMDPERHQQLFWIAREGLKAPLPAHWKPCRTNDTQEIYYFNFERARALGIIRATRCSGACLRVASMLFDALLSIATGTSVLTYSY